MSNTGSPWKLLSLAAALPILVIVAIDISLGDDIHPDSFKRFGNALLTSYVLTGLLLMGNLFFYADSRHRPLAPFVGMMFAVGIGVLISWSLVSYDDLLLEDNSGMRAQMLSNIVRLMVSSTAMLLASMLAIGTTFAMITGRKRRVLFEEEE
jgi:Trk-type K+ transport system membrane component